MADWAGTLVAAPSFIAGDKDAVPATLFSLGSGDPVSTTYIMQANDSVTAAVYAWSASSPDWAATGYPGPNSATDVRVAGVS